MLHLEAIEPRTLSLLKKLFGLPQLKDFYLAGGTALALRFGHRTSVDLDIFSVDNFDINLLTGILQREFRDAFRYESRQSSIGIFSFIEDVKVDIVHYPHPMIAKGETVSDIRFYANEDIAAMKVNAILGRGMKKDFWDMSELLLHFSLDEIIGFYRKKYPNQMLLISIPNALTYFVDAEESETPASLKGQTWEEVKAHIRRCVSGYLK